MGRRHRSGTGVVTRFAAIPSVGRPAPEAGSSGDTRYIIIAAVLPLTQLIQLHFVGTLLFQDLIDPFLLLMLLGTRGGIARLAEIRPVLLLIGLWFAGAVMTDLYLGTVMADLARGWSRIVLFAVNLATLWLLSGGGRVTILAPYFFTTGLVAIVGTIINPSDFAETDAFKFGAGGGLLLIAGAIGSLPLVRRMFGGLLPSVLVGTIGLVALTRDSRSLFAICSLAAAYSAFAAIVSRNERLVRYVTPLSFATFVGAGLMLVQALVSLYARLAASGALGSAAQLKYLIQTSGDSGLLLAGRSESLISVQAIIDSPIVGHGSWAQDPYYVRLYFAKLAELGLPTPIDYYISTFGYLIPTHSYVFGAWVEAGILGVPIWVYLLILIVRALYAILRQHLFPNILVSLAGFSLLWDVPFSPFATSSRFLVPAQICIMLAALRVLGPRRLAMPLVARAAHSGTRSGSDTRLGEFFAQ